MAYGIEEDYAECQKRVSNLEKENAELKLLLEGADIICVEISKLVGYTGQYRDLTEAVTIALQNKYEEGKIAGRLSFNPI